MKKHKSSFAQDDIKKKDGAMLRLFFELIIGIHTLLKLNQPQDRQEGIKRKAYPQCLEDDPAALK